MRWRHRPLGGVSLVQAELHFGITLGELLHHGRQHVARLGVGGGEDKLSAILSLELLPDLFQVVRFVQDAPGDAEDGLAGLGDGDDAFAVAHEDRYAQLLFQLLDLLADAGLRGIQRGGGIGDAQAAPNDLVEISELLQIHGVP
jgi:hypothetical protein